MHKGFSNIIILVVLAIAFGALLINLINTASSNLFYDTNVLAGNPSDLRGTIELEQSQIEPRLGSKVRFTVILAQKVKLPRIQLVCYQGDDIVYSEAGQIGHSFTLGGNSSKWADIGGEANCVATIYEFVLEPKLGFASFANTAFAAEGKK